MSIQDNGLFRRWSRWLALAGVLSLLLSCGKDSGDEDLRPPPAPRMLVKNCPGSAESWPERGVDAEPGNLGIRLEWELPDRPSDLAGFEIYRAEHPDSSFLLLPEDPERFLDGNPASFFFVDTDLEVQPSSHWGDRFWYLVRALDDSGNRSQPSDTVTYRLWEMPRIQPGWVQQLGDTLRLNWQFQYADFHVFGFRGFEILIAAAGLDELLLREEVLLGLEPSMTVDLFPAERGLVSGDYRLRIDTRIQQNDNLDSLLVEIGSNPEGCPLSGSESNWISFTFQNVASPQQVLETD